MPLIGEIGDVYLAPLAFEQLRDEPGVALESGTGRKQLEKFVNREVVVTLTQSTQSTQSTESTESTASTISITINRYLKYHPRR